MIPLKQPIKWQCESRWTLWTSILPYLHINLSCIIILYEVLNFQVQLNVPVVMCIYCKYCICQFYNCIDHKYPIRGHRFHLINFYLLVKMFVVKKKHLTYHSLDVCVCVFVCSWYHHHQCNRTESNREALK